MIVTTCRGEISADEAEMRPAGSDGANDMIASIHQLDQSSAARTGTDLPILAASIFWELMVLRNMGGASAVVRQSHTKSAGVDDRFAAAHAGH